jgi:hypothetical protein
VTYSATSTNPAQSVSASIVSSSLDWTFKASYESQSASGTLTYRVTASGCSGWSTSVSASQFAYTGLAGQSNLPADSLVLTSAGPPSSIPGTDTGVASTGQTGGLGTARKVITAQPGRGNGSYEQQLGMVMNLPAGTSGGTYQSTITVTTSAAP